MNQLKAAADTLQGLIDDVVRAQRSDKTDAIQGRKSEILERLVTLVPPQQRRTWFRIDQILTDLIAESQIALIQQVGATSRAGRLPKAPEPAQPRSEEAGTRMIPAEADCVHQVDPARRASPASSNRNRRRQHSARCEAHRCHQRRKANHPLMDTASLKTFATAARTELIREVVRAFPPYSSRAHRNVSNAPRCRDAGARHRQAGGGNTGKRKWPAVLPTPGSTASSPSASQHGCQWLHRHRRGRPQPIRSASLRSSPRPNAARSTQRWSGVELSDHHGIAQRHPSAAPWRRRPG